MPRFERICPECGASNSYSVSNCKKCRAPLTGNSASPIPPAALFTRRTMALLAWRATKFLARKGYSLAREGTKRGIRRVQNRHKVDVRNETIDAEYNLSDWRVWSKPSETPVQEKAERMSWGPKK